MDKPCVMSSRTIDQNHKNLDQSPRGRAPSKRSYFANPPKLTQVKNHGSVQKKSVRKLRKSELCQKDVLFGARESVVDTGRASWASRVKDNNSNRAGVIGLGFGFMPWANFNSSHENMWSEGRKPMASLNVRQTQIGQHHRIGR